MQMNSSEIENITYLGFQMRESREMNTKIDLNVRNLLLLSIFSIFVYGLYIISRWYLENRRKNSRISQLLQHFESPPSCYPIIGHALRLIGTPTHIHNTIVRHCFKHGPNFVIWLLNKAVVIVGEPEDVEKILQSQTCLEKGDMYRFTRDVVGNGLFSAPRSIWRRHRKIINPSFNARLLDSYQPIFGNCASIFVNEILPSRVGKKDVDWYTIFTSMNLDVLLQTGMGIDLDVQRKPYPFAEWMEMTLRSMFIRTVQFLYYPDFIFFRTKMGKILLEYRIKIWNFVDDIISQRKKKFQENLKNNMYQPVLEENSTRPIGQKVFLDFLLEMEHKGMKFTDEELRDEASTFFVGGADTTSISGCFFLTMMGMHQDIQQRVYEEVTNVLDTDRLPTIQDLNNLQYMERCLKESMRIWTPIPIITREVIGGDLKISNGVIPEGASVAICFFYMHRSELYWENPLKYDPDRFLPDQVAKRHPYTFIPFSAGLRGCIGQRYAYVNLKTLLSQIIRKYKIHCDGNKSIEEIELKSLMTLRPTKGFKFWLEKRDADIID